MTDSDLLAEIGRYLALVTSRKFTHGDEYVRGIFPATLEWIEVLEVEIKRRGLKV